MFKVGDRVVCIDNIDYENKPYGKLELHKIYTIDYISNIKKLSDIVGIKELNDIFGAVRFVLLSEYRKQKIEKVCQTMNG